MSAAERAPADDGASGDGDADRPDGGRAGDGPGPGGARRGGDPGGGRGPSPGEASRRRPATAQERDRPPGDRRRRRRRPRRHRRAPDEGKEERDPERLGGFLEGLLEKWGIAEDVERASAVADWDEIVGEELARRTHPAGVKGETLFVEVESASWMQELNMMRHTILRRMNAGREKGRVEKIVFLQAGRSEESRGSRDRKGRS